MCVRLRPPAHISCKQSDSLRDSFGRRHLAAAIYLSVGGGGGRGEMKTIVRRAMSFVRAFVRCTSAA